MRMLYITHPCNWPTKCSFNVQMLEQQNLVRKNLGTARDRASHILSYIYFMACTFKYNDFCLGTCKWTDCPGAHNVAAMATLHPSTVDEYFICQLKLVFKYQLCKMLLPAKLHSFNFVTTKVAIISGNGRFGQASACSCHT